MAVAWHGLVPPAELASKYPPSTKAPLADSFVTPLDVRRNPHNPAAAGGGALLVFGGLALTAWLLLGQNRPSRSRGD
jgi:hypothetical protein